MNAAPSSLCFVGSCSYALTVAALNIRTQHLDKQDRATARRTVLVLHDQMSSNVYPWQRMVRELQGGGRLVVPPRSRTDTSRGAQDGGACAEPVQLWTDAVLAYVEAHGSEIAVAALPNVHWCDGEVLDLERIGAACRAHGIGKFAQGPERPDWLRALRGSLCWPVDLGLTGSWCSFCRFVNGQFWSWTRRKAWGFFRLTWRRCSRILWRPPCTSTSLVRARACCWSWSGEAS